MKKLFFLLISTSLISILSASAQPHQGWKAGMNINWINFENSIYKFSPGIGYHIGYAWGINCSPKVNISIESLINRKSVKSEYDQYFYLPKEERDEINYKRQQERLDAYGLSIPLGINFMITPWLYASGGYEFSWFPEDWCEDDYYINTYDHAFYLGSGFHTRYFDFVIRYSKSLNSEKTDPAIDYYMNGNIETYPTETNKTNNLQFSIILSLGKKNKKE
ncbi:hypothetical protein DMA11_20200 [Marinilabiliaceae bacterium JC017]|nr:hypothetical protein DMA11_20200 [Marinilabiliaceae bacterium JC017]